MVTSPPRRPHAALLVALLVVGAALVTPAPAAAYHTPTERVTDESAYTLNRRELRIGLWKIEYGLLDSLTVGTYPLIWLFKVANLSAKYEYAFSPRWSVAARLSLARLDLQRLNEESPPAALYTIPFELWGSHRLGDSVSLSAGAIFSKVGVSGATEGEAQDGVDNSLEGAAAVTNLQLAGTLEWRLTRVTALQLHGRWLAYQDTTASSTITLHPDEYTTVEVVAAAESDAVDVANAFSVVPSFVFSWQTFRLRLGLGYGNFNVPVINFVVPVRSVIPELDLYWRW